MICGLLTVAWGGLGSGSQCLEAVPSVEYKARFVFSSKEARMTHKLPLFVAALVAVGLIFGSSMAYGAERPDTVRVRPGTLVGTVSDSTGQTLAGVQIRLAQEGETVALVFTDKDGRYELKDVAAGKYDVFVASERPLQLVATLDAETSVLRFIVGHRPAGHAQVGGLTLTATQWAILGGATAAAVVTPVVVNNPKLISLPRSSSGDTVSPNGGYPSGSPGSN